VKLDVQWTENAVRALRDLAAWVDRLRPGQGTDLAQSILDRVDKLGPVPWSAPGHPSAPDTRIRRLVYGKYIVIYRVRESAGVLQVLTVRHHRQRPVEPSDL